MNPITMKLIAQFVVTSPNLSDNCGEPAIVKGSKNSTADSAPCCKAMASWAARDLSISSYVISRFTIMSFWSQL
jgi:hypothetical protein